MRISKKLWTIILIMMFTVIINAQTTNIPDTNFEKALIDLGIDKDGQINGSVATSDIAGITTLDVSEKSISIFTGIEDFVSLMELYCQKNSLSSLKLSNNTKLTILNCSENNLTALNISSLPDLKILKCSANKITEINVSVNTKLEEFYCDQNILSVLNLKDNPDLLVLNCSANQFSILNLTYNWKLKSLNFSSNLFETIDLVNMVRLEYLDCSNNPLTTIFLNNMTELKAVNMVDNDILTRVNFGHNYRLEQIICRDNNLLTGIDLIGTTALKYLNCSNNKLSQLNLSTNLFLENLYCQNNELSDLDLGLNTLLSFLKCNNNKLKTLNLKNGNNTLMTGGITRYDGDFIYVEGMNASGNPALTCIQVDNETAANAGAAPYVSWIKDAIASYSGDCTIFLGIEEDMLNNSIKLYPNPTKFLLRIDKENHAIDSVIIYSVLGSVVREVKFNFSAINITDLARGLYFVRINSEDGVVVKRFIKM